MDYDIITTDIFIKDMFSKTDINHVWWKQMHISCRQAATFI